MKHYGVIVAGGGSRRYGQDKAFEKFDGKSFLEITQELLQGQKIDSLSVLGRPELDCGIADPYPKGGPAKNLSGWINGLVKPCRVTVLPVDMPGLNTELLTILTQAPNGAYFDDLYLPFSALVTKELPTGIIRMRDLMQALGLKGIDWPAGNEKQLKNINTPDDFARFQR